MFLPEYLFYSLENATIDNKKLVSETRINLSNGDQKITKGFISPKLVFSIFLIISLFFSFNQIKNKVKYVFFDNFLFLISGIVGLLISFLWIFTDHISTNNLNILWAFPLNILLPFFFTKRKGSSFIKYYLILYSFSTFAIIVIWVFYPEYFNDSLIVFVLAIFLRSITNIIDVGIKKQSFKQA